MNASIIGDRLNNKLAKLAISGAFAATALLTAGGLLYAQDGYSSSTYDFYKQAPPAVADNFPVVYESNQILESADVDLENKTVTLPLHQGQMKNGKAVWYVLTDVSDEGIAEAASINYSPKLRNVSSEATRTATLNTDGTLTFVQGTVDFTPERVIVPGDAPDFFPPKEAQAGSIGDSFYSPLVRVSNAGDVVYNATMVAFDVEADEIEFPDGDIDYSKVIDRAVAISPAQGTVTFNLNVGASDGRAVLFLSLDSNDNLVSALEGTTYSPRMSNIPTGMNDRPNSAVAANYVMLNGPMGTDNPQKQGVNGAIGDGNEVLDVFDGVPGLVNGAAYSPMWDLYFGVWTDEAMEQGYTSGVYSELQMLGLAERGWITSPDGSPLGASGAISNCPLIMSF